MSLLAKVLQSFGILQNLFSLKPLPDLVQISVSSNTCSKNDHPAQIMHVLFTFSFSHLGFHAWQVVTWSGQNFQYTESLGILKSKCWLNPVQLSDAAGGGGVIVCCLERCAVQGLQFRFSNFAIKAPIQCQTQSNDPVSCYRKPAEL